MKVHQFCVCASDMAGNIQENVVALADQMLKELGRFDTGPKPRSDREQVGFLGSDEEWDKFIDECQRYAQPSTWEEYLARKARRDQETRRVIAKRRIR